jgi:hypothetical protein
MWFVYRAGIRVWLCAIILVEQRDSWQGVSPLICLNLKVLFSHKSDFSYLSSIERRVESVEETLQSLQRHITGLPNYGPGKHSDITLPGQSSDTGTAQLELQEVAETTDSVDAMGALVFANEEESGFFGRLPYYVHDESGSDHE